MSEVEHDSFSDNDLRIDEYTVELDRDEVELSKEIAAGFDAVVVVKALEGELVSFIDAPAEVVREDENGGRLLSISTPGSTRVFLKLTTKSYAKVKVFIAKLRKGAARAINTIPCTICKKAIALMMFGFLVAAGVPPIPGLGFDLTNLKVTLIKFFKDVAGGVLGSALKSLAAHFGPGWEQKTSRILDGLNWIFEPAGIFYESACNAFSLCP